jgi:hypothetical protein
MRRRDFITLLGGVAARGARAATSKAADYRVLGRLGFDREPTGCRFCAAAAIADEVIE